MSHMIADSTEELLDMAKKIGISPIWLQDPRTPREHFDICLEKKRLAITLGAKEIGFRDLAKITALRPNPNTKIHFASLKQK